MASIQKTATGYRVREAGVWRERDDGSRYRDRRVIGTYTTKREALAVAAAHETRRNSPDYIPPSELTCRDWRTAYVQSKVDQGKARSYTRDLESTLRTWWSSFDHVKLQQLQPEHLEAMKIELAAKRVSRGGEMVPLSRRQQTKVWSATEAALSHAVRRRALTWDPTTACEPPAVSDRAAAADDDLVWWEPAVISAFLEFAHPDGAEDDVEHMLRSAVSLNFHMALRPGELSGLRWTDRAGGVVKIRRTRSMVGGRAEIEERAPKTERGRRDVAFSPIADQLWRGLQARQTVVGMDGYVFAVNGEPVHPQRIIDCFQRLQAEFRVTRPDIRRLRFYDVRHCGITMWLRAGIDTATVSRMAGHASFAFTVDHYREVLESDLTDAAAKMGRLFG